MKAITGLREAVPSKPRCRAWGAQAACALLLWACIAGAHAASVYKCVDAHGRLAYQDTPCAARAHQRKIDLQPLPTIGDAAEVAQASRRNEAAHGRGAPHTSRRARTARASRHRGRAKTETSWECRAADGEVFYRHARCPSSIPGDGTVRSTYAERMSRTNGRTRHSAWSHVRVHGVEIPRTEACRRIHSAGAAVRDGHLRDETVSTYDHLMGRDPCSTG